MTTNDIELKLDMLGFKYFFSTYVFIPYVSSNTNVVTYTNLIERN